MTVLPVSKEILARGRHFGTWMNEDGSAAQRIYPRPIHRWSVASGQWIEMDNAILEPWKFRVDGRRIEFTLGDLQVKSDGGAVRNLANPDLATAAGDGSEVTHYVYPGIEVAYAVGLAGVKEIVTVQSLPDLPGNFKAKWMTISGTVRGAEGLQRQDISCWDAEGNIGPGYLAWEGDEFQLGVDIAWLYAASLPVVIDPTIYSEGNDISLWWQAGQASQHQWRKCFVKFDISSIPDGANITAATLNLYCAQKGSNNKTLKTRRFASQAWTEEDTVASLDAMSMGADLDSTAESSLTTTAYNSFIVRYGNNTDGLEKDVVDANQYFTGGLWYDDTTNPSAKDNSTSLHVGKGGLAGGGLHSEFNSAEAGASNPYLDVTYTTNGGASRLMSRRLRHWRFQADRWHGAKF